MRDSWIRWMGWVGEERNSQVLLITRKQFLLQTGWIFWFSYQKSELGGREALKQFLSPSFSIHTKEVLASTNTGQPVAHHTALLCLALAPLTLLWLARELLPVGIGLVQQDP